MNRKITNKIILIISIFLILSFSLFAGTQLPPIRFWIDVLIGAIAPWIIIPIILIVIIIVTISKLLRKEKWIKPVLIILLNIIVIGLYFIVFVSPVKFNFLNH